MKLYVYITDPESFLKGDYGFCFDIRETPDYEDYNWFKGIYLTEIDIDIESVNRGDLTQAAITTLDIAETEIRAEHELKINALQRRKSELLAITHQVKA